MEKGDADRIIEAFQGLRDSLEALHSLDRSQRQEIHINAGGIGVWVATTCCLIMLACFVLGSVWVSRELNHFDSENQARKSENEKAQSYISAIYVLAPSLRPKESTNKKE